MVLLLMIPGFRYALKVHPTPSLNDTEATLSPVTVHSVGFFEARL